MNKEVEHSDRPKFQTAQLKRLGTLVDVVYALVLWRCFALLPLPAADQWNFEGFQAFMSAELLNIVVIFLGVIITIIYWLQSNVLFGNLRATDTWHTLLSILQVFFLLLFLRSIRVGTEMGSSVGTRAFESVAAALMGLMSSAGWSYAMKGGRLLLPEVDAVYAKELRTRTWAEPTTAMITLPCAFVGPGIWELAWFIYPVVRMIAKRIKHN
jgi:hypothetical protein